MANEDRYESLEICRFVGLNPGNENVYLVIENDMSKGYRISVLASPHKEGLIREIRLSNRGKLESYLDRGLGMDV